MTFTVRTEHGTTFGPFSSFAEAQRAAGWGRRQVLRDPGETCGGCLRPRTSGGPVPAGPPTLVPNIAWTQESSR